MKKTSIFPVLICIFLLNVAGMCSSDNDSSQSADPTPVINIVSQGTWYISSYIDSGVDETNHFTGYNFTFGTGSVLTATNGVNSYTGTWSVTADNSTDDDDPSGDLDFNVMFNTPVNFEDLSDDWDIVSKTNTEIQLIDVSGGGGGTDYLTFQKN